MCESTINVASSEKMIEKTGTGIVGLDDILFGGLPKGRATLITGAPGNGKTVLAMELIRHGATRLNEPGILVSFEESTEDLVRNFNSFGNNINNYMDQGLIRIEYFPINPKEVQASGEYDLDGLFVRLGHAIQSNSAKRIVLDAIDALFSGFEKSGIVRAEIRRLLDWLKSQGVTVVLTGDGSSSIISKHSDLAKYVVDCVIELRQSIEDQIATRKLRIVKYRGSAHGADEHPFFIDSDGLSLIPVTSAGLEHDAPSEMVSSGIERFDSMLGGAGFYKGSSILVSGSPGTGKTSIAATFTQSAASRGEKVLFFAFEESPMQIIRNMSSIGMDLERHIEQGLLKIIALRPTRLGLEHHLSNIFTRLETFEPAVVVFDPLSGLISAGDFNHVRSVGTRLVDKLKSKNITAMFTDLVHERDFSNESDIGVSSVMDCWVVLKTVDSGGERNRGVYVLKARGLEHSNQLRELIITESGIKIADVYLGQGKFAMGSQRLAQEAMDDSEKELESLEMEQEEKALQLRKKLIELRIQALETEYEMDLLKLERNRAKNSLKRNTREIESKRIAAFRKADEESL